MEGVETGPDVIHNTEDHHPFHLDDAGHHSMPMWETAVTIVSLSIIIVLTIFGNVLVILSVFTYRPLRIVQNFFIVSLAVADLTVAVFVLPFNVAYSILGKWIFGIHLCEMWLTCDIMCCTASILNLCAIALDRYWAITDPINYAQKRTLKRVLIMIGLVWVISLAISLPPLLGWNDWPEVFTDETPCVLSRQKGFVIYSSAGSFYCPLVFMLVMYVKIFIANKRRLRERAEAGRKKRSADPKNVRIASLLNLAAKKPGHRCIRSLTPGISLSPSQPETSLSDSESNRHREGEAGKGVSSPAVKRKSMGLAVKKFIAEKQRISLTKERRLVRTLFIIMGSFVVCWLPFFLAYVILGLCVSCPLPSIKAMNAITWLGYFNSLLNPVIYTIFNKDFQRAFISILRCRTHLHT